MECQKPYYHQQNDSSSLRNISNCSIPLPHPSLDYFRSTNVQCPRQSLPKVHCELKEQKYKMVRESSHLYSICKFLVPSLPTPASLDSRVLNSPYGCQLHELACSTGSQDAACYFFSLYEPSSVHVLLFHWATTWLNHNPRAAKLNLRWLNTNQKLLERWGAHLKHTAIRVGAY
jgi:hypothetical protein